MLIHTSVSTAHHTNFEKAVRKLLVPSKKAALIERCRQVYETETARFTKEKLRTAYPDYERPQGEIPDYPTFDDILPGIELLLSHKPTPIPMSEDQE